MDIPDEVQFEMLKWYPVKTLTRFRAVSPAYRDVIDSRWFVKEHHRRMEDRLLLRYSFWDRSFDRKAVYALCDDDLATVSDELHIPDDPDVWSMVGVSKGVLCMASAKLGRVVLLNPATRQAALLPPFGPLARNGGHNPVATKFGFGLHDEFRVLVIGYHEEGGNCYCRVHVCTNSGGAEWRWDPVRGVPPLLSGGSFHIDTPRCATFLDGVFYWLVFGTVTNPTVPVVEFDPRRGTFGSSEVRVRCTSAMEATLAVCGNNLDFILFGWWGDQFLKIYRRGSDGIWSKIVRINVHLRRLRGLRPPKRIETVISYFKPGQLLLELEDDGVFVFQMNGHAGDDPRPRTISLRLQDLKRVKVSPENLGAGSSSSYVYQSPQVLVFRESLVGLPGGLPWDPSGDTYFRSS